MVEPTPDPALGEAAEGFAELARWFTGLAADQLVDLARAVDSSTTGAGAGASADAVATALARAATLPLLGWAALASEVLDAATILGGPLWRDRPLTSGAFQAPGRGQARELDLKLPLVNGFGDELPSGAQSHRIGRAGDSAASSPVVVVPTSLPPETSEFTLYAAAVPPEFVGVYRGLVTVRLPQPDPATGESELPVDVWLVVP